LALTACLVAVYAAAPYVTLWRLYRALGDGDARTLAQVIDWQSVRQGLKDDIAEGIVGLPSTQLIASNSLPPFGAGFVNGIAGGVVDQEVTPEKLAEAVHISSQSSAALTASSLPNSHPSFEHAFFTGPTSFVVSVRCPGQDADTPPLRVELGLRGTSWKVVRAWIPQDLMDEAHFHT
jgi:hypothetical protein